MMKKTALVLLTAAVSFCSRGDVEYLYWYLDQSLLPGDSVEFAYARLQVINSTTGDSVGQVKSVDKSTHLITDEPEWSKSGDDRLTISLHSSGIIEDWQSASYAFQLELYNETSDGDFELVRSGMIVNYEALKNVNAIAPGGDVHTQDWNALGPAPVPEPTGGTLALLGLALLGLRRKRMEVADRVA